MTDPNPKQRELIDRADGCVLVDAGPGTGKTFAVTRRYARIIEQDGVAPEDVLLLTFTRNAATEMRDRIVRHCTYDVRELRDAPIGTFHSICHDILRTYGIEAPTHLGIDEAITQSTAVLEDDAIEETHFREFVGRFADNHPEHHDVLKAVSDPTSLLSLVNTLASRGVVPTADGWYRGCDRYLEGDRDAFEELLEEVNRPRNDGSKQSVFREQLSRTFDGPYRPDAPERDELRGDGKAAPRRTGEIAFEEERTSLFAFVHDLYHEYLSFALSRNYLTFGFLQVLAFVLLCEDDALREHLCYDYVMIDEFQDTSEIQFKIALLLSGTENLCVVGDWKQSIYSFQYADVKNITAFEDRLERFVTELNDDRRRIRAGFEEIHRIELDRNYRSTQLIVDESEHALTVRGSASEQLDTETIRETITHLHADTDLEHSRIEAISHEDELGALLTKLQEIVGNEAYGVRDEDGDLRPPRFGDVAVLTRTRDFGRELLTLAEEHGIPMAYEGGIEVFRTDPAKLLLAWLRILEAGADENRGWAAVLEHTGYTYPELEHFLETKAYPKEMRAFREELSTLETVSGIAYRVFERYGFDGPTAAVLRDCIQSLHANTSVTRGDLIRFIERGIDEGTRHEVRSAAGSDSVTVQTIHSAKGLEYPIVLLANMNAGKFPSSGGGGNQIGFDSVFGLRQRTLYGEDHGEPHLYDNWRWDVLKACRQTDHSEERRLLYVAMTRAKDHIVCTAGENPSPFLDELPVEVEPYEPNVETLERKPTEQTRFDVGIPEPAGPSGFSPHSLMDDSVFADVENGRGSAYGSQVHEFAERYALGAEVEPSDADERRIADLLDSLAGTIYVEQDAYLPLEVDGERVTVHGIVDLVHVTDDSVTIIDYKTDLSKHATDEYRTQLSVYWHVLASVYPNREVTASVFYTADGERVRIDPLSTKEIADLVVVNR